MAGSRLILGCWIALLCIARQTCAAVEPDLRRELREVLALERLNDFACLLAREAYAANARTLRDQPAKLATVEYYRGLVEIELGEKAKALEFLSTAEKDAPPAVRAAAQKLQAAITSAAPESLRSLRPVDKPGFQPQHKLALEDLPNPQDDVIYEFYDPADFRSASQERARRLLGLVPEPQEDDYGHWLVRLWALVLAGELPAASRVLKQLERDWDRLEPAQCSELAALGASVAARLGSVEDRQAWLVRLRAGPPANIWSLRGLQWASGEPDGFLRLAQSAIREKTRELEGPFDRKLLNIRTRDDQARLVEHLDLYWEACWCYRRRQVQEHGFGIPANPGLPAVRGGTLAVHLASPSLRQDWDLLRIVMLADLLARQRDLQTWQLELTNERLEHYPALGPARYLARVVAGTIDLPDEPRSLRPEDEEFAEEAETLLLGEADLPPLNSGELVTSAGLKNSGVGGRESNSGNWLWLALVGAGAAIAIGAGTFLWWSREEELR